MSDQEKIRELEQRIQRLELEQERTAEALFRCQVHVVDIENAIIEEQQCESCGTE
jgi:hypothetical protein